MDNKMYFHEPLTRNRMENIAGTVATEICIFLFKETMLLPPQYSTKQLPAIQFALFSIYNKQIL